MSLASDIAADIKEIAPSVRVLLLLILAAVCGTVALVMLSVLAFVLWPVLPDLFGLAS